jgi:ABC-type dipeptide/oligopeptide/nickel transport system permease subunit
MRLLRDPAAAAALGFVLLMVLAALLAPWIAPTDPFDNDLSLSMKPPGTPGLPLGRRCAGAGPRHADAVRLRASLLMGFVATAAGGVAGVLLGFLAAYYQRWLDGPIMRLMDMMLSSRPSSSPRHRGDLGPGSPASSWRWPSPPCR